MHHYARPARNEGRIDSPSMAQSDPLRVLLDTSAIRGILHADAGYRDFDTFDPREADLSSGLANSAVPELALALFEGRIAWNLWSQRVGVVTRFSA